VIIEHALITILPGHEVAFEQAFLEAAKVIAAATGFRFVRLSRGVERSSTYLLLVGWDSIDDHTVGFRGSDLFTQWRSWIGPHFDGTPQVEHYVGDLTGL